MVPWEYAPYSLVSWWDMEKFSAVAFYDIAATLQEMRHVDGNQRLEPNSSLVTNFLPRLKNLCSAIGLTLSVKHIDRLVANFSPGSTNAGLFQDAITELHRRIADEMEEKLFFYVPSERATYYNQAELLGKDVNAKFPSLQFDIAEAGNCYATGRGTAVVFHLMRITENGVQAFGNKLGVILVNEKNWQNILDEINKKIKTLPPKDPSTVALSQASANLYAVKLAWRNEVMHPKDTYTLEEADNLIRQVKLFMEQLATIV
jgi:hypothetical protein